MPTKEEILKKQYEGNYEREFIPEYGINPIYSAMEEYAKQEALGFIAFIRNHEIRYGGCYYTDIWEAYQKSKSN